MSTIFSPQHLNDVTGLVAVVTGGGTGLGLIAARVLEANGATVYITGRRQEKLDEAVKLAVHGKIIPVQGDTSNHDDVQRLVDLITKDIGHLDLLICNAGTLGDSNDEPPSGSSISDIRSYFFNPKQHTTWVSTLNTNVAGVLTTTMGCISLLDAGNQRRDSHLPSSQVITLSSVGALSRGHYYPMYAASKAAVIRLSQFMGSYLVPHKIRCNVIAPGYFPTDMTTSVQEMFKETDGVMPQNMVPQGRMGTAEEFAGTILYLASRAGGYCNGSLCKVDGGCLFVAP